MTPIMMILYLCLIITYVRFSNKNFCFINITTVRFKSQVYLQLFITFYQVMKHKNPGTETFHTDFDSWNPSIAYILSIKQ